jgi:Protein of unknown function (DUF3738)
MHGMRKIEPPAQVDDGELLAAQAGEAAGPRPEETVQTRRRHGRLQLVRREDAADQSRIDGEVAPGHAEDEVLTRLYFHSRLIGEGENRVSPCRTGVVGCLCAIASLAQTAAQTPKLEFEVASVRAMGAVPGSAAGRVTGGPGTSDPERVVYERVTVFPLLREAFNVAGDQISGPSWVMDANSDGALRFEIQAKVSAGATAQQMREMLKHLLIERFGMKFHAWSPWSRFPACSGSIC